MTVSKECVNVRERERDVKTCSAGGASQWIRSCLHCSGSIQDLAIRETARPIPRGARPHASNQSVDQPRDVLPHVVLVPDMTSPHSRGTHMQKSSVFVFLHGGDLDAAAAVPRCTYPFLLPSSIQQRHAAFRVFPLSPFVLVEYYPQTMVALFCECTIVYCMCILEGRRQVKPTKIGSAVPYPVMVSGLL